MLIERGQDRRQGQKQFYDAISDRRRPCYDRRGRAAPLLRVRGTIRPGADDVPPREERRRYPESGME
jgi:hypothetical protein